MKHLCLPARGLCGFPGAGLLNCALFACLQLPPSRPPSTLLQTPLSACLPPLFALSADRALAAALYVPACQPPLHAAVAAATPLPPALLAVPPPLHV